LGIWRPHIAWVWRLVAARAASAGGIRRSHRANGGQARGCPMRGQLTSPRPRSSRWCFHRLASRRKKLTIRAQRSTIRDTRTPRQCNQAKAQSSKLGLICNHRDRARRTYTAGVTKPCPRRAGRSPRWPATRTATAGQGGAGWAGCGALDGTPHKPRRARSSVITLS
jgi:hypothetical protein